MSSSQALVRVGEPLDMFYQDHANAKKQAIKCEYDTRYTQDFSNKISGTSVFTIPPNQGIRHIVIVLGYSASTMATVTSGGQNALPRGWGYNALQQLSFRIGGSSQYFHSGAQLLARNLRMCRTKEQRNSILSLGGAEISSATTTAQYAYIPYSVWATPSDDALGIPLSSDLLSQQVQITATLNPASAFWLQNTNTGVTPVALPTQFDTAYFQVEQIQMVDRAMGLANRINMNEHMYSMALPSFDQQEVVFTNVSTANPAVPVPFVLTGFRAGEVKKIQVWLSPKAVASTSSGAVGLLNWVLPASAEILYAGLKYATYLNGSSAIWNLLDGTAPSAVDQSQLVPATASSTYTWTSTPVLSQWVELPFAQPTGSDYEADVLTHGKEITNGIVNLNIGLPDTATYDVHIVYVYNCVVGFSKGSAELIF